MDDTWFDDYRAEHDSEDEKVLQHICIRMSFLVYHKKTDTAEYRNLMKKLKFFAGDDLEELMDTFEIQPVKVE